MKELRALIHTQQQKMTEFQQELNEQRFLIAEQRREMQLLKVTRSNINKKKCQNTSYSIAGFYESNENIESFHEGDSRRDGER